jgi:hypothetical protein
MVLRVRQSLEQNNDRDFQCSILKLTLPQSIPTGLEKVPGGHSFVEIHPSQDLGIALVNNAKNHGNEYLKSFLSSHAVYW